VYKQFKFVDSMLFVRSDLKMSIFSGAIEILFPGKDG